MYNVCRLHLGYNSANSEVLTTLQMYCAVLSFSDIATQRPFEKLGNAVGQSFVVLTLTGNLSLSGES